MLVGEDTKRRKHVDWEIYSSMFDGTVNKKSGILVVNLPGTSEYFTAPRPPERAVVYPDVERVDLDQYPNRVRAPIPAHASADCRQSAEARGHNIRRTVG